MTWEHPQILLLFWIVAGMAVGMAFVSLWRKTVLARLGDPELVGRLTASRDIRKRLLKNMLILLAMAAAMAALAQPRTFSRKIEVMREGVDLVIAVDVSLSMLADDIQPSRWESARAGIDRLIEKAPVDRIGLIGFSGNSQVCPLTPDRRYLRHRLAELDPNTAPVYGTSVSTALQSALSSFVEKQRKARILLLVTDGEDHQVSGLHLAHRTRTEGLQVFVIGIGTPKGHPIPIRGKDGSTIQKTDADGRVVRTSLNETLLERLASETGGTYYAQHRLDRPFADHLLEKLEDIQRLEAFQDVVVEYKSQFQWPLLLAMAALLLEVALSERKRAQPTDNR